MLECLKKRIEVPILFTTFAITLAEAVTTNWLMYETCYASLGFNQSDCDLLGSIHANNFTIELEEMVQPHVTIINMTKLIMETFSTAFLCFFIGTWCDKYGRKPVLLLSIGGYVAAYLILALLNLIPSISPWFILLYAIPLCVSGGMLTLGTTILCYITDISCPENRGMRITLYYGVLTIGHLLGTISSSYALHMFGYFFVFSFAATCTAVAWLFTYFVILESLPHPDKETELPILLALQAARDKLVKHYHQSNWIYCTVLILDRRHKVETFQLINWGRKMQKDSVKKFEELYKKEYFIPPSPVVQQGKRLNIFNMSAVKETIKVALARRDNNNRKVLMNIIVILVLYVLNYHSEKLMAFLYVREKFHWSLKFYTLYNSINTIANVIGSIIGIYVVHKLLGVRESIILIIGQVSIFTGTLILGLANFNWHVRLAGISKCFAGTVGPMARSLISKIVPTHEYGKVFSFIAICESLLSPLGSPLYTYIYNHTLSTHPGAYLFISSGICLIGILLSIAILIIEKKEERYMSGYIPIDGGVQG